MAVKVVADSASDLPADLAKSLGIAVVPCNVNFGTETYRDGVDLSADEFYRRLMDGPVHPTTSQPSVGEFLQTYDRVGVDTDGIVSVHVSSRVSGTYNSAVQASAQSSAGCPIEVVDSAQASMGIGMIAMAAARAAAGGADVQEVASVARAAVGRAQLYFLLNTLEYLQKGGRIGKAAALVGTLLSIKPMCIVKEGEVHQLGKARTFRKGVDTIQGVTRRYAPLESLCVLHSTSPDLARDVAQGLRDLLPEGGEPLIARAGPTIGTYVGPGVIGIALLQAEGAPTDAV